MPFGNSFSRSLEICYITVLGAVTRWPSSAPKVIGRNGRVVRQHVTEVKCHEAGRQALQDVQLCTALSHIFELFFCLNVGARSLAVFSCCMLLGLSLPGLAWSRWIYVSLRGTYNYLASQFNTGLSHPLCILEES